ncbi:hypothetical protein KY321_00780 [Candidatus Woesearchaeota archaeon]|nr:hypothetical protein [Candidatus Woesearchaeota archaeon]
MDHLAIMRKSWGLTSKILTGEKKIESRWYKNKYQPWDRIKKGDNVYFKDSGSLVNIKCIVSKVLQYEDLTPARVADILNKYGSKDGLGVEDIPKFIEMFKDKKYCMLIFLENAEEIEPFDIDKSGFGAMAAWISVENINEIKK